MNIRVIPKLDIKGQNLVKGLNMEGLRVLGRPETFAQYYYQNGADELVYQDVVASLFRRNTLVEMVSKMAKNIFIPLTVGGGISSLDDIEQILRAGADKVSINTAGIASPDFLRQAIEKFGSSTIVVAIEAMRQSDGSFRCYTDNDRNPTGRELCSWVAQVQDIGVGELLITSITHEGAGKGYDEKLYQIIKAIVRIPMVIHGGVGKAEDVLEAISRLGGKLSGISMASILHYAYLSLGNHCEGIREGNTDFMSSFRMPSQITPATIQDVKQLLLKNNIPCRMGYKNKHAYC